MKKRTFPRRNLIGEKFGKLTVTSFCEYKEIGKGRREPYWNCTCTCSNVKKVRQSCLVTKSVRSCGCLLKEVYKNLSKLQTKRNKLPVGVAAFNCLYSSYKSRAKLKNREFKLTKDDFRFFTKQNCHYCGAVPKQIHPKRNRKHNGTYTFNGLDRKDNKLGYIKSNIITACGTCNKAKHTLTYEQFIDWLEVIKNHFLIVDLDYIENKNKLPVVAEAMGWK